MVGCDWNKKKFSVCMRPSETKVNPCHACANNKFRGGKEEICNSCTNHNNFKPRER